MAAASRSASDVQPSPTTVTAAAQQIRDAAGLWIVTDLSFIRFTGPDAATWLQSQTSNDVLKIEDGAGHANAHLDRKGHVIAPFTLHRMDDEYWCLTETSCAARLVESLDAHLFIEDAQIYDSSADVDLIAVQGNRASMFLARVIDDDSPAPEILPAALGIAPLSIQGYDVFAIRRSSIGGDGYVLMTEAGNGQGLYDTLLECQACVAPVSGAAEAVELLRIEAGVPKYGVDYDESNRLPETTLDRDAVSFDKGCYVGQEVIAKLKTYSSVKRALMGLVFDGTDDVPAPGNAIMADGKDVGRVTSAAPETTIGKPIALAYLDRDHRAPGSALSFETNDGVRWTATVRVLPIVEPADPFERARALYDEALVRFDADADDTDATAIELLEEAVVLDPTYEDAYESLGVILHRHGRTDEAIAFMQILARMNPDCLMAHTNLSVFYVAKGMIDEAEEEKARAAVLQMKQASDARKAEDIARQERERLEQEARERIDMFKEVLEIDPDDSLATFGLGQSYMQLQQYEEAVPHLERATKVQKDYSAAYLNLGKCLEFLKRNDEAAAAYKAGIEAANRKGDLMPLREMERRLSALGNA